MKKKFDLPHPDEFKAAIDKRLKDYEFMSDQCIFLQGVAFTLEFLRKRNKK